MKMSKDTIYRQAAIDVIDALYEMPNVWLDLAVDAVMALPSAQSEAKPPKWIAEDRYIKNKFAVFLPHCPQCNYELETGDCYCRVCGQHIDWSENE